MDDKIQKANICIDCKKAIGGCSWSQNFTPVEGWTATETYLMFKKGINRKDKRIKTYRITECPLFERDDPNKTSYQMLTPEENEAFMKERGIKRGR